MKDFFETRFDLGGGQPPRRANLVLWLDLDRFLYRLRELFESYSYRNSIVPNEVNRYNALHAKQRTDGKRLEELLPVLNSLQTNDGRPLTDYSNSAFLEKYAAIFALSLESISPSTYMVGGRPFRVDDELANQTALSNFNIPTATSVEAEQLRSLINDGSYNIRFNEDLRSTRIVSPTSSSNSFGINPLTAIFIAGIVTVFLIFLFLGIVYRLPGIVAGLAIAAFTILSLVIFS
jgi:hypothetical protein